MAKTTKGIQCPKCKDKIFSLSRHDFRYCSCKTCFVDGGTDYLRYGWTGTTRPKKVNKPKDKKGK